MKYILALVGAATAADVKICSWTEEAYQASDTTCANAAANTQSKKAVVGQCFYDPYYTKWNKITDCYTDEVAR